MIVWRSTKEISHPLQDVCRSEDKYFKSWSFSNTLYQVLADFIRGKLLRYRFYRFMKVSQLVYLILQLAECDFLALRRDTETQKAHAYVSRAYPPFKFICSTSEIQKIPPITTPHIS